MTNLELIETAEEVRDTINYFLKQAKNPECRNSEEEALRELRIIKEFNRMREDTLYFEKLF